MDEKSEKEEQTSDANYLNLSTDDTSPSIPYTNSTDSDEESDDDESFFNILSDTIESHPKLSAIKTSISYKFNNLKKGISYIGNSLKTIYNKTSPILWTVSTSALVLVIPVVYALETNATAEEMALAINNEKKRSSLTYSK